MRMLVALLSLLHNQLSTLVGMVILSIHTATKREYTPMNIKIVLRDVT